MDFLAQTDHTNLIIKLVGVVFALNSIGIGIMLKLRIADKKEFDEHKKSVQYKDTCVALVAGQEKLAEERHTTVTKALERIEGLIKNGNGKPRVQT